MTPPFIGQAAFFLDIDGTLLDIAETPYAVEPKRGDCALIGDLQRSAKGAVALISGRSLASIDELFAPLVLPAAGQHGVERRDPGGRVHRMAFPVDSLQRVARDVESFARRHEGLVFENKGHSVALHYRLAPELAEAAHQVVRKAARRLGEGVEVQAGKMVAELKPAGRDKGMAIEEFMREAPFAGRIPVFLGDDVTDEYGFRVVNRLGGHSVKIGKGPSEARWRLADAAGARAWLRAWLDRRGQAVDEDEDDQVL
jgi:trehalose 6-phosphate phosphatase